MPLFIRLKKFWFRSTMASAIILAVFPLFFLLPENAYTDNKNIPLIRPLQGDVIVDFRQTYFDEDENVTRKHTGIDISGKSGRKVVASANGIVCYIGFSPIGGRTLVIRHNEKLRTTYLNLMQVLVSPRETVIQGQEIALIGANDDPSSEIIHLHFGIIFDGYYLNPEDIFEINYNDISEYLFLKNIKPDFKIKQ